MFYEYGQNNSGGSFYYDAARGISVVVVIEANSPNSADAIAESIGIYFDGCESGMDCDCCGDRWSPTYGEGTKVPSRYGKPLTKDFVKEGYGFKWQGDGAPEAFVHYADGRVEGFLY